MVISGSTALALVHPNQFLPNDIDFYVLPPGFSAILKYIEDHGYKIEPYDRSTANYFHQNIIIVKLIHPTSRRSVNVMTSIDDHVVKPITRFHSTLVMNYLSWFGLVVLYPEWTLDKRSLIVANAHTSVECIMKYVDRGYTLYRNLFDITSPSPAHICEVDAYCPLSERSLHDGHCAVESFEEGELGFVAYERDMRWKLPMSCSFSIPGRI